MVCMQAALGLASALSHYVVAKTVEIVGLIGMYKTGCSGQTRLVPHVPGSSRAGKRFNYHYYYCYYYFQYCYLCVLLRVAWYACRRAWSALSVESANHELKQGLELSKKLQQGILKYALNQNLLNI